MTLSEAIRLGAMLKPQGFGAFNLDGRTCAIGAAHDAVGGFNHAPAEWVLVTSIPRAECPACSHVRVTERDVKAGAAMIVHLNDEHKWTREQIADWVETVERRADAASVSMEPAQATAAA